MAVNSKLRGGDRVPASSPAKIPCLLGTCPLGVVGQSYAFDPGNDVVGTLGGGKLAQAVLYLHATAGCRVVVSPTTGTYPSLPAAVVATGVAPPAVALSLTPGNPVGGAYDDVSLLLTDTVPGLGGVAQISVCYDGFTVAETRTIPAELPAKIIGTAAITPTTLATANALTLVSIDPAAETLTLPAGSLAASPAGLFAAVASVAAPVTVLPAAQLAAGKTALAANPRKIRFTTGGLTPSDAPPTALVTGFDFVGAALSETVTLSQIAGHASTVGAFALPPTVVYATADGTGATLAIGYEDAYATVAELVTEFNTLAVAAPLAVLFTDEQTAAGHFLGMATTATGTGALLELNPSSTALALFGFAASVVTTGAVAAIDFPFTGVRLTFPATGPYPVPGTFAAAIQGPRSSVAALQAAAIAAHDAYAINPFGFLATVEDFATQANAAAALTALNTLTATWLADPSAPIFCDAIVGTALHVASAVKATNDTNIATNDTAFLAAFPPSTPDSVLNNVAHDDVYIPGAQGLPLGTYRRSATWCGASKVAGAVKIAANPADGGVFGATLLGPDNITRARNENTATTKLGTLGGPGAWVLKSTSRGMAAPAFEQAASRAGSSSRLRDPGAIAVGLEILRISFGEVEVWDGETWEGSAVNPVAADITETDPRAHHLDQLLGATLRPSDYVPAADAADGAPPNNVTSFDVAVTAPNLGNDGKVLVLVSYNPLNCVGIVSVTATATGASITSAG